MATFVGLPDVAVEEIIGHAVPRVLIPTALFHPSHAVAIQQALSLRLVSKDFNVYIKETIARSIYWAFKEPKNIPPDLPLTKRNRKRLAYRPFLNFCALTGICHWTKSLTLNMDDAPYTGALSLLGKCSNLLSLTINTLVWREPSTPASSPGITLSQLRVLDVDDTVALALLSTQISSPLTLDFLCIKAQPILRSSATMLPTSRTEFLKIVDTDIRGINYVLRHLKVSAKHLRVEVWQSVCGNRLQGNPENNYRTCLEFLQLLRDPDLLQGSLSLSIVDLKERSWDLGTEVQALQQQCLQAEVYLDIECPWLERCMRVACSKEMPVELKQSLLAKYGDSSHSLRTEF